MSKRRVSPRLRKKLPVRGAELQVGFWARLQQIRPKYLADALAQTVNSVSRSQIDRELGLAIGDEPLEPLTARGIRGEVFFPVVCLLECKPQLLGYYRLLYGFSQKEFYKAPYGRFWSMEERNLLTAESRQLLPELCATLVETGKTLLKAVQPVSIAAVHELQLLTVGPQLRGSQNVLIGKGATKQVSI